jgi:hypothetical protein
LRQRFALVAPAFREEAGDEEHLAFFPHSAISANAFAVGSGEMEGFEYAHGLARIIHEGSWRKRADAMRDGHSEP